jgi:anion-transporting  ArsA/GET3 family ATPase
VRENHYDLVVVDAPATGHIVGQLAAPRTISGLVQVGVVREQARWMVDLLQDPAVTGVAIVASPEEMPVNETVELAGKLGPETGVNLAAVIVNRVLPELFGRGEEELFAVLRQPAHAEALAAAVGSGADEVLEAAELAVTLRRTRAGHLARLRRSLDPSLPFLYVPELFGRARGVRATRQVAAALGEELGF